MQLIQMQCVWQLGRLRCGVVSRSLTVRRLMSVAVCVFFCFVCCRTQSRGPHPHIGHGAGHFEHNWPETLSCSPSGTASMDWQILWPSSGQIIDLAYDFGVSNQMMVRTRISSSNWQFKRDGYIFFVNAQHDGSSVCQAGDIRPGTDGHSLISDAPNAEIFGFGVGCHSLTGVPIDRNGFAWDCWPTRQIIFSVLVSEASSRVENARRNDESRFAFQRPWIDQPATHKSAFATFIQTKKDIELAVVWAESLRASASIFPRICVASRGRFGNAVFEALTACCCQMIDIDADCFKNDNIRNQDVTHTDTRLAGSSVCAKNPLKAYQHNHAHIQYHVQRLQYDKVVVMKVGSMILQNIDELMWVPAPSCAQSSIAIRSDDEMFSCSVMVLDTKVKSSSTFAFQSKFRESHNNVSSITEFKRSEQGQSRYFLPLIYASDFPSVLRLGMADLVVRSSRHYRTVEHARLPVPRGVKILHMDLDESNQSMHGFLSIYANFSDSIHWLSFLRHHQRGARRAFENGTRSTKCFSIDANQSFLRMGAELSILALVNRVGCQSPVNKSIQ